MGAAERGLLTHTQFFSYITTFTTISIYIFIHFSFSGSNNGSLNMRDFLVIYTNFWIPTSPYRIRGGH
ncbi:hypothetical protein C5167_006065 [Papaver somniferum]|uniref:Uncharacterized protein n=1 Tax=Papaver somniferum TaxID=3469 RepID=A0A4Y7JCE0_PAPSO|nr:hypothetical protein C5167_006065 [Papaver somniferum]